MDTLWNKGVQAAQAVEDFTVGKDRELDLQLARYDIIGSKAHIAMLREIGLLASVEEETLQKGLDEILATVESGEFKLEDDVEDIHSQVELLLSRKYGDLGKKIHAGRSRNDQVLVDVKLFLKDKVLDVKGEVLKLFKLLQSLSEEHKAVLMPGYTHGQIAMPSSFGLWFGAYAETLADDMTMLRAAYTIADENPLGSAAGYGSSFPLDRERTTELLQFGTLDYNSVAAQMSRGKAERAVSFALASVASTLNKLAEDCCTFMCQNYAFISFPDELTTGSSIMPHKKNPDVWEMVRGKCNRIESVPNEIAMLTTNLPSGYHRDLQLLKDTLFPAIADMEGCLEMSCLMLENIRVRKDILDDPKYDNIFTVEEVNKLALNGMPFRDAYRKVGQEVKEGTFKAPNPSERTAEALHHTHEGSIGNLCTEQIGKKMAEAADFGHKS
jgi:argininosuccinate lyase